MVLSRNRGDDAAASELLKSMYPNFLKENLVNDKTMEKVIIPKQHKAPVVSCYTTAFLIMGFLFDCLLNLLRFVLDYLILLFFD